MNKLNWPLFFALANIAIHLLFYNNLEFHRDELLYFSHGLHPAWGYASVPPLIGWIATFMQHVFGFTLFSVKLFPALLSGIFIVLCAAITKELGGKNYAQALTALTMVVVPFNLRTFHLFQPVHLDLFFWTLVFYLFLRYINTVQDRYLIFLGLVFGLALLNKYLIALLIPALGLPMTFTPMREIWKKKALYGAIGLALIIWLPNLIWQYTHHFPVIKHMSQLNASQLVHVNKSDFLKDLLLMPFIGSILTIPGLIYLLVIKKFRIVGISILIVIISLLILRGKSYYALGVFPVMIAAGALVFEKNISNKLLRIVPIVMIIGLSIPILPIGLPVYGQQGLVKYFKQIEDKFGLTLGRSFEDGSIHSLPQDYADQLGWNELTEITNKAYQQIPDKSKAIIYAENYGQAGAISIIGKKYGLPEAISFNDSYRYWAPRRFDPDIEYFIYINDELGDDVKALFSKIQIIGIISNPDAREFGTLVYLCSSPLQSFNILWGNALKRVGSE
jgi:Dolichyl-phosphate-mannose-protein mannosyltransferase